MLLVAVCTQDRSSQLGLQVSEYHNILFCPLMLVDRCVMESKVVGFGCCPGLLKKRGMRKGKRAVGSMNLLL